MSKLLDMSILVEDIKEALGAPAAKQMASIRKIERMMAQVDNESIPQMRAGIQQIDKIQDETHKAVEKILRAMLRRLEGISGSTEDIGTELNEITRGTLKTTDTLGRVGTILANLAFLMDSNPQLGIDLFQALLDVPDKFNQAIIALDDKEFQTLTEQVNRETIRRKNADVA